MVPGPVGRGRPGGAASCSPRARAASPPGSSPCTSRASSPWAAGGSTPPPSSWTRRAPAGEEMGELQRFSPALWGLAECALLTGDSAAAVALTEAGYDASHEVADAANLFPFLVTGTRARLAQQDPTGAQEWVGPGRCRPAGPRRSPARCPPSTTPAAWSSWPPAGPARRATCSAPPTPAGRPEDGGGRPSGARSTWPGARWPRTAVPRPPTLVGGGARGGVRGGGQPRCSRRRPSIGSRLDRARRRRSPGRR